MGKKGASNPEGEVFNVSRTAGGRRDARAAAPGIW